MYKRQLQEKFGRVIVMADGAHAFGAQWHGKMCGEIADFTNFSFHAVKNMEFSGRLKFAFLAASMSSGLSVSGT